MNDNIYLSRLCNSGSLDQIDSERLSFTNTDITNKPRVVVRGLWIFKFVQRTYKRITSFPWLLISYIIDPWTILLSKSHQSKYFHNQANRTSIPAAPSDSSHVASLR
jgi:hypothetical protein